MTNKEEKKALEEKLEKIGEKWELSLKFLWNLTVIV